MSAIFQRLSERQVVVPYLENAFHSDQWPDVYNVRIDASPYYGLTDTEGVTHDVGVGDGYFHPSSHPLMHDRELFYRFHPDHAKRVAPERRTLRNHMTLAVGTAMHAVVQTQLSMAKILERGTEYDWVDVDGVDVGVPTTPRSLEVRRGRWVEENPFEWEYTNETHLVRGRIDGVLDLPNLGRVLFEYKTMNSRSFRFLDEPKPEWDNQTQLGMDNADLDEGVILVQEMGYPWDVREFRVQRRRSKVEAIYEKFDRVQRAIAADIPPTCAHPLGSDQAKICPVGNLCWPAL